MEQVQFNKRNENPFMGLSNCLSLQQSVSSTITEVMLDRAWAEVKDSKQARELFYTILFSVGDITNRQHNIFKGKKIDNGGNANRETFYTIVQWMWKNDRKQFIKFMNAQLFNEYSCFDVLFRNRVQTKGKNILKVYSTFHDAEYRKVLLDYLYAVINGSNPFNKMLVAKFLTIPRTSKRKNHKQILPQTKQIMSEKKSFIEELSKMMGWEIPFLKGYREWRKQFNGTLESVMFSTGKINEFTKDEFIDWFGKLPAQARFRVKNRILYSEIRDSEDGTISTVSPKWAKFQPWIKEWETYKEKKQKEQRVLEEKVRQGQASEEDKVKLQKVKKEAKVTVGATNFNEIYADICNGNIDKLKLESFINKINLDYNTLVIIDDSGSMRGAPFNFATFLASVCLVKNPDDDARNLIGFFGSLSHWHSFMDSTIGKTPNSIMRKRVAQTNSKPLVDPNLSFYDNYQRISRFCNSVFHGGGTDLRSVIRDLKPIVEENPELLDTLKSYPVWTIVSDGDINSSFTPRQSILDFFTDCENAFGFKPYLVLIDIPRYYRTLDTSKFEGIPNFMYIPGNVALIEQFLVNFKDIDVMDVYQSLLALYRSNRYELVRANTL